MSEKSFDERVKEAWESGNKSTLDVIRALGYAVGGEIWSRVRYSLQRQGLIE